MWREHPAENRQQKSRIPSHDFYEVIFGNPAFHNDMDPRLSAPTLR